MTDWDVFRSACLALISGQDPYLVGEGQVRFFNPVWTLIPLLPLALCPPLIGLLLNAIVSMSSMALVTRRLRLGVWGFFWVAISPMHLQSLIYGNVEWLPLLGLLFPAPVAILFFTTKPQATVGLILLTLLGRWRAARWKGVLLAIAPTVVLALLSVCVWGLPPVPGPSNPGQHSLFPYSLLVGFPALVWALKRNDRKWAAFAGPFISPYVTFHGYLPALFPFKGKWMALAVLISFIPVILGIVA